VSQQHQQHQQQQQQHQQHQQHRSLPLFGETRSGGTRSSVGSPIPAIARKGFRPFFFLAALFAVGVVPLWLLTVFGIIPGPSGEAGGSVDVSTWHAHEMIFGYTMAVIAGFLLTAVSNWTGGRETLVGKKLLGLAGIWVLGRIVMATPTTTGLLLQRRELYALIDLPFIPLLMIALARPLIAAKNWRNLVMLAVLGALFLCNLTVHLDALGLTSLGMGKSATRVSIDVVIFLCLLITGRVLPMFTRNALAISASSSGGGDPNPRKEEKIESHPIFEKLMIAAMVGVLTTDIVTARHGDSQNVGAWAAGLAGIITFVRAARWGTSRTLKHPLLWILHAGYGWIGIGLLARATTPLLHLPLMSSLATHALTLGAIGALTLGMMARVALGHTGRPLVATRPMTIAFLSITVAALARVAVPLFWPSTYGPALIAAGLLWTVAFVIFLAVYTSILFAPRVDLNPG
jgi:uncharacterized protein involved in response to NO